MKNKKILGIPMLALVLGILVVGMGTAALVNHLSNTATVNVEVTSPMSVQFVEVAEEDEWTTPSEAITNVDKYSSSWSNDLSLSTTALSTVYLGVKVENLADVKIEDKFLQIVVKNSNWDVTCKDISSLTFIDVGASSGSSYYEKEQQLAGVGLCSENSGKITYNIPINSLDSEQVYKYPVKLTFDNVNPDNFIFEATMLN